MDLTFRGPVLSFGTYLLSYFLGPRSCRVSCPDPKTGKGPVSDPEYHGPRHTPRP